MGEWAAVARVASFLRRGLGGEGDVEELFALTGAAFGAHGAMFSAGYEGEFFSRGVALDFMVAHQRLFDQDPSREVLLHAPAGTWWLSGRDMTEEESRRELSLTFAGHGYRDAAIVRCESAIPGDLVFGLYTQGRPFTDLDADQLGLFWPHLSAAAATRRLRAVFAREGGAKPVAFHVSFPAGEVVLTLAARRAIERLVGPTTHRTWRRIETELVRAAAALVSAPSARRTQAFWPGIDLELMFVPPMPGEVSRVAGFLLESTREKTSAPVLVRALLSDRQLEVARLFADGMDVPTIAEALALDPETVRTHLRTAYQKLRVSSRSALGRALEG